MYPYYTNNISTYNRTHSCTPCHCTHHILAATSKKVVGYYPGSGTYFGHPVLDIDASKLTHLNYAFAKISNNNEIEPSDPWADTQMPFKNNPPMAGNFGQLMLLKKKYPHLQTLISIGGATGSNNYSDVALTDASRKKFADSAVKFIRTYSFDGVDIDWEFPVSGGSAKGRPEDKENFTLLMKELRDRLDAAGKADGKKYLLTIAAGPGKSHIQNTEMSKVQDYTDWINVMAYDYHGNWEKTSGHNAPLFTDPQDPAYQYDKDQFNVSATVQNYLAAKVPASKLVVGIPFYGKGWTACSPKNRGEYQSCLTIPGNGIFPYGELVSKCINKNGYTRYWNDASKVPFLFDPTMRTFITYEDPESIRAKTNYILTNNLAGAMVWELTQDSGNTLLTKVHSDLNTANTSLLYS